MHLARSSWIRERLLSPTKNDRPRPKKPPKCPSESADAEWRVLKRIRPTSAGCLISGWDSFPPPGQPCPCRGPEKRAEHPSHAPNGRAALWGGWDLLRKKRNGGIWGAGSLRRCSVPCLHVRYTHQLRLFLSPGVLFWETRGIGLSPPLHRSGFPRAREVCAKRRPCT